MGEPVIVDAVRTPIGKRDGLLRGLRPEVLYAKVLDALLERNGLAPEMVDDVITGCVTQAGEQGMNVGRLAVLCSRLGHRVPAVTLNRMCGSSQQAVHFAAQAIAAGDARVVVAGGVESMTRVPMFLDIGDLRNISPPAREKYELIHQGESAERIAERYGLSRRELDEFSYQSHVRAARATREGRFSGHLVPVEGLDPQGRPAVVEHDEGIRFEPSL
ncbi:MAG: beta-ketoacyl synthase N-terminal-like domain-containing protein, partial [Armatimonadota bacterium]|nr:thiolase family protein [Armatimonadota bacterium]MDW8156971.1 beta-ketoacyl synthase N-terminal-like domain-containing protein [Armatimonadota bacterium]